MSLPKCDRALCLFNVKVLRAEVADTKMVLESDDDDEAAAAEAIQPVPITPQAKKIAVPTAQLALPQTPDLSLRGPSATASPAPTTPGNSIHTIPSLSRLPAVEIIRLATSNNVTGLPLPKADPLVVSEQASVCLCRKVLKPLDIEIMKRLGTRVNLIPVVTKADTLTQNDLFTFKQHESADHTRILTDGTSFSIIGPTEDVKALDGRVVGGCEYRCDQQLGQLAIFGRLLAADHYETLLYLTTLLYPTTMGIKGLWKVLEPVEQKTSLSDLAVRTGFVANTNGVRGYRIGIDASGWIYRACSLHGRLKSPELVVLFSRCSRLFRLPFIPVFVFDGPGRPKIKRGIVVRGTEHRLTSSFKRMLDGFGFEWHVAPGEAEATLAAMTTSGIPFRIDAILTDDSDSFVFGAETVLCIRSEDNEGFEASQYSAHDVSAVLGFTREDLILIALLVGGDYSDGLPNCGMATAMGLAHAGLGRQLVSALAGQSDSDAWVGLKAWRQSLRSELRTNSSGRLPHRCGQLADAIPKSFPDLNVVNLYLHPLVSQHASDTHLILRPPRLDILACFAEDNLRWGDSVGILKHFEDQLFAGLVIRELVNVSLVADGILPPVPSPSIIKRIVGDRRHKSTGHLAELRVLLGLDPAILKSALEAIAGTRNTAGSAAAAAAWITITLPKSRVWVPQTMIEHVSASSVLDYITSKSSKRTPSTPKSHRRRGSGGTDV